LAAGTPSEATAALTGQLTALAEHYRVRLDRTDAVPDSLTVHDLERVTIRSAIEGDTRGTLDFLGALATALPVLSLDEVRVAAPNPGSAGTAPEILCTELTVHGWYLHREAHR
jgi:hypothetical protein